MFASLPAIEASVAQALSEDRPNDALAHIVGAVHLHHKQAELANRFLYYPVLDRQLQQMADRLATELPAPADRPLSDTTLVIATELYQVGGHSHVVADVLREARAPVLLLTDLFWSYRREPAHLQWVVDKFGSIPVFALPQGTPWAKCQALHVLAQRLQPRSVLYFNHHQDPIPFVGTLAHPGSRKVLVHHCDHNPSLGVTLPALEHVDFTDELARTCSSHLHRPTQVLPLYAPDQGCKAFSPVDGNRYSVVTSGTHIKFARAGDLALQGIVRTVLQSVGGEFIHIGPINPEWVAEIKAHLAHSGLDPERFRALGSVPSLWQTLAGLDAHLYMGSAPVGGGRAAVEAQGCGYPMTFYRITDQSSTLAVDSVYAHPDLGWSTLDELRQLLRDLAPTLAQRSQEARAFYERRYSHGEFRRVLGGFSPLTP